MVSDSTTILTRTFVHAPGVGHKTERALWAKGVTSWAKYLDCSTTFIESVRSQTKVSKVIEQSIAALERKNTRFFVEHLPRPEWWRLYSNFKSKVAFLDIETTGLSHYYDEITLVGVYNGERVKTFFAGHDLKQLPEYLRAFDVVVTFNGTLFDLPFLKTKFTTLRLPSVHLDLRFLLKRLGYSGGLKAIERTLSISRKKDTQSIDGLLATVLWARYKQGDISALEQLIKYNIADVTNLQSLLEFVCHRMAHGLVNGTHSKTEPLRIKAVRAVPVRVAKVNGTGIEVVIDRTRTFLSDIRVERPSINLPTLLKKIQKRFVAPRVVGIDLRASDIRPTGWALVAGTAAETKILRTDDEIVSETIQHNPDVISIDSPLGIPSGRCCTQDSCDCRAKGILRECERTLWRRGVRVFPCLLPSMQKLTERGMRLASKFRQRGYKVIESYPGAAQDIMRIPRKKSSLEDLARGLQAFGIHGACLTERRSHDEMDAITSAVVGYFYLAGHYEALGNDQEEWLIIPKLDKLLMNPTSV